MHGHVPRPPEDVDVVRVPPIAIEISIGEMQQFTDQIQKRVERQVEEAQPDQMVRYLRKKKKKTHRNCTFENFLKKTNIKILSLRLTQI